VNEGEVKEEGQKDWWDLSVEQMDEVVSRAEDITDVLAELACRVIKRRAWLRAMIVATHCELELRNIREMIEASNMVSELLIACERLEKLHERFYKDIAFHLIELEGDYGEAKKAMSMAGELSRLLRETVVYFRAIVKETVKKELGELAESLEQLKEG
jgi:hypothetical protein